MKHIVPLVLLLFTLTQNALATERTVRLDLPTINCAMCPLTVKKALTRLQGVSKVDVSYEKKEALVTFDDTELSPDRLIRATTNAGYPSTIKK